LSLDDFALILLALSAVAATAIITATALIACVTELVFRDVLHHGTLDNRLDFSCFFFRVFILRV
jgi:hypothetical protein